MKGEVRGMSRVYFLMTILYFLFLVGIVILADCGIARWFFLVSTIISFGDKICHMILAGIFSFLLNSAFNCRTVYVFRTPLQIGSMIAFVFVLGEEVSQFWVVSRNVEVMDLIFDFAGVYIFGALASLNIKIKSGMRLTT